jgi:hypothetical protein
VPVALTDAIISGTAIGNTRIESITSLAFVVADMAEKIVPMVEKPNVPKKIINPNGNRNGNKFTLYRMVNIDSVNTSIIAVKMNTTIIFAKYIPHGLTGQRSKPGRVPHQTRKYESHPENSWDDSLLSLKPQGKGKIKDNEDQEGKNTH